MSRVKRPVTLRLFDRTDDLGDTLDVTVHLDESPVRVTTQMYDREASAMQTANFTSGQIRRLAAFLAEHDLGAETPSGEPLWEIV